MSHSGQNAHSVCDNPAAIEDLIKLCAQVGATTPAGRGTTTAISPDGTKTRHSHGPPARPG
jgi:hypothetical protein